MPYRDALGYIEPDWTVLKCARGDHRAAGSAGKGLCRWELCRSTWRPCGDLATSWMSDLRGHVSHAIAKRTAKQLRTRMKILTWQDNAPQTRLFFRHVCLKFLGDGLGHKIGTDTSGHGVVSLNLNEQTIAEAINHRLSLSLSLSLSAIQREHYSTTRSARGQRAARVRELLMELGVPRTKMRPQSCKAGPPEKLRWRLGDNGLH